ncbi:hypothetical protein [Micromonospora sp. KC606]|uniref:hypothetical protein n=1 Tax=Micromonospora sp. KC606 TaxID=2530379 RepID=UPI0014054141|nr:hypothetical protein [Micromonospora sp. KC606]
MPTILDCTLRDGGYYTNWNFTEDLVEAYLAACVATGIDVVELGYVRPEPSGSGPFGNLPAGLNRHLAAVLPRQGGPRFAVMVDGADFLGRADTGDVVRDRLAGSPLPVEIVRIAVSFRLAEQAVELVDGLRAAGFRVCVNLMQIGLATETELHTVLDAVRRMDGLEALYLADSLGSLLPARTRLLTRLFAEAVTAPIGFHAHENQGLALHNTLSVLDAGATWADATMSGMGRGAGNARMEQLLPVLRPTIDVEPLFDFVARFMIPLQQKHGWGANVYYALAGLREIHPSYVQHLEQDASIDVTGKMRILRELGRDGAAKFSADRLRHVLAHA